MMPRIVSVILLAAAIGTVLAARPAQRATASLSDLQNIIIVYRDGWSFDSLYGNFPEANGLDKAKNTERQADRSGKSYTTLPQQDSRIPANLPVEPFDLSKYIRPAEQPVDPAPRFYQEQLQIDRGRMDRFVAWSDAGSFAMGGDPGVDLPEGKLAKEFTLADKFYHAAFGGAFLNFMWSVCACTPVWPNAPADIVAQVGKDGTVIKDGIVTADGYAVNSAMPLNKPYPASASDATHRLPLQSAPTIGDRLTARNISWRWYSAGYDDAMAGKPDPLFQFDRQPYVYFERYGDGTEAKTEFLKDQKEFVRDLTAAKLPSVSFVNLSGQSSMLRGEEDTAQLVDSIRQSPYWQKSAIFIVYIGNGGHWDRIAPPPPVDRWGVGTRVPAIIVSPFAKKNYVDHTPYEATSMLAFIERRWNLRPLTIRDARASDLTDAFEFIR